MSSNPILFITFPLINFICISLAFDTSPLTDFCVADPSGKAPCKDPKTVTADDFYYSGLRFPGNSSNPYGTGVNIASVATVPGFNTLGLTFARVDFAPNGYFPPHIHFRATELVSVLEGAVEVGFVTSYPEYKFYTKTLYKGDLFIIPVGLVHYVRNVARRNSAMTVVLNSQSPGYIFIPDNVFAAKPAIDSAFLARAFKLEEKTVKDLQTKPWYYVPFA